MKTDLVPGRSGKFCSYCGRETVYEIGLNGTALFERCPLVKHVLGWVLFSSRHTSRCVVAYYDGPDKYDRNTGEAL